MKQQIIYTQDPFVSLYDIKQHKTTLFDIENGTQGGKCVVA